MALQHTKAKLEVILKAFKKDCKMLLNLFSDVKDGRYEDFVALWNAHGFSLCLLAHGNIRKICIFCKKSLEVAKELLLAEKIEYSRIGALYLLFLIFERQFDRCKNRIKLTLPEFRLYTDIVCDLYEKGHEEAKFIYLKLEKHRAIFFIINSKTGMENKDIQLKEVNVTCVLSMANKALLDCMENMVQIYKDRFRELVENAELSGEIYENCVKTIDENIGEIRTFLTASKYKLSTFKTKKSYDSELSKSRTLLKRKSMTARSDPKHTVSASFQAGPSEQQEEKVVKRVRVRSKLEHKRGYMAEMMPTQNDTYSDNEGSDSATEHFDDPGDRKFDMSTLLGVSSSNLYKVDSSVVKTDKYNSLREQCDIKSEDEETSE